MSGVEPAKLMSVDQYLSDELNRDTKHELIDGSIFAMAGASKNHERIIQNLSRELGVHLKSSPCEPFGSDMKVRVRDNFFYPDVLVDCSVDEDATYYTDSPVIIVEVISKSTRKNDKQRKFLEYINIPTLQEYIMIEQDYVDVTVCRKSEHWRAMHYFLGDSVTLESIDLTLPVEDIYLRVHNEDMLSFLDQKKAEQKRAERGKEE